MILRRVYNESAGLGYTNRYFASDLHGILAREEREHSRVVGRHEIRGRTPGVRSHPLGNGTRCVGSSGNKIAGWVRSLGSSRGGGIA